MSAARSLLRGHQAGFFSTHRPPSVSVHVVRDVVRVPSPTPWTAVSLLCFSLFDCDPLRFSVVAAFHSVAPCPQRAPSSAIPVRAHTFRLAACRVVWLPLRVPAFAEKRVARTCREENRHDTAAARAPAGEARSGAPSALCETPLCVRVPLRLLASTTEAADAVAQLSNDGMAAASARLDPTTTMCLPPPTVLAHVSVCLRSPVNSTVHFVRTAPRRQARQL